MRVDRRRNVVRERIRRGLAGAMLVTAGVAARFRAPRRLSRKMGKSMIGRSMRLWKAS
jgi:hypothetical protein